MFKKNALVGLLGLILPLLCQAQQGGDMQAQIVYAYQTEDSNLLGNLAQGLDAQVKESPTDVALRYHLAHAEYRIGMLALAKRTKHAETGFEECVEQLKELLNTSSDSAEALALQSTCYSRLADNSRLQRILFRSQAESRMKSALKTAPRNPRVLYLAASDALLHARAGSAERQAAFTQLQLAAELFGNSSATRVDVPGWGHAEAYLTLGLELRARGDVLGARNWIEKSLIVAPDFKAAQRARH